MAVLSDSLKRVPNHREEALIWPPLKIGQRGAAGKAPENTLAAFELALREGAEGIVLNAQLSADGVPVVISDARLSRTTSGRGRVREKQAHALIQLDAGSWFNHRFPSRARPHYAQEPVPLLFEVLHWVRARKCMALVAINHPSPDTEIKVLNEIDRAKVRNLTRVIAYNLSALRRLRQLDPKINLGLHIAGRPPAIREVKAVGAEVLLPHWKRVSPSFIRQAHRASMLVIPWTVDSLRQMRRTILEGADGIITNYPAKLTRIVARLRKSGIAGASQRKLRTAN
ncbi:MAG TPA: glycerophosphodiester phosphodiesterase family protein [Terriglobia bacterium]|nr:glycerophosphodiester phosphodiesterase family protein [Terriglobia bacterium]